MLFIEKLHYAISWLKNDWSIYQRIIFVILFVLQLFVFCIVFVHDNILFFVMFFVVLYVTAVPKICDVLLLLRMTSYRRILRIPFGVRMLLPQHYY